MFPERSNNIFKIENRSGGLLELNLLPKMLFLAFTDLPHEERTPNWDNFELKRGLSQSWSTSTVTRKDLLIQKIEKISSMTALKSLKSIPLHFKIRLPTEKIAQNKCKY